MVPIYTQNNAGHREHTSGASARIQQLLDSLSETDKSALIRYYQESGQLDARRPETNVQVTDNKRLVADGRRQAYNAAEICAILRISPTSLHRLAKRKLLVPLTHLRHRIYTQSALDRFLNGGSAI